MTVCFSVVVHASPAPSGHGLGGDETGAKVQAGHLPSLADLLPGTLHPLHMEKGKREQRELSSIECMTEVVN